jgi:hypothetical protein
MSISLTVANPLRGQGTPYAQPVVFSATGMALNHAWGAQPATARIEYHASTVGNESIAAGGVFTGAFVTLSGGGHTFYGLCMGDQVRQSSNERVRELNFHDLREFLKWDQVFGSFNLLEYRTVSVNGRLVRRRRWRHILPADFNAQRSTWTDAPLTATQILGYVLGAPTVFAPWNANVHADMNVVPVSGLQWGGGMRLDNALTEIAGHLGLVFTFSGVSANQWWLTFARKGYGTFPLPVDGGGRILWENVAAADDTEEGLALSEAPTHLRVLGDRNQWQLLNVTLVPDWASAWEAYYDEGLFIEEVFNSFGEGATTYAEMVDVGDPEQIIARQKAAERAHRLTVAEFATIMGSQFLDQRLWAGRNRAEMPAMLYLRNLLFRAYRLPDTVNVGGTSVASAHLNLLDRSLVELTHDPATGVMSPVLDAGEPRGTDDRGYAVAQGFNLDQDFLSVLRPDQIDSSTWNAGMNTWNRVDFQVMESGEGRRVLVFELPMVIVTNLVSNVDGWIVPNAASTLTAATVKASLTVEAEQFLYDYGDRNTGVENGPLRVIAENGLHEERVWNTTGAQTWTLTYMDGKTATAKAAEIVSAERVGAQLVRSGGYKRYLQPGDTGTALTGLVDSVTLEHSAQGLWEIVRFTLERGFLTFQPERDYERRNALSHLFPGQAELRKVAEDYGRMIAAMRGSGTALREFYRHWHGLFNTNLSTIWLENGASGALNVGTPLWKGASTPDSNSRLSNTRPPAPANTGDTHSVFAGVVVRDAEPASSPTKVATEGTVLLRVMGPVNVGDMVGRSNGHDYLVVASSPTPLVGQAQQAITTGVVRLINVRIGSGGGSGGSTQLVWK